MSTTSDSSQLAKPVPRPADGPEAHWNFLEKGLDKVMNLKENEMSYSNYMELYTVAANLFVVIRGHQDDSGLSEGTFPTTRSLEQKLRMKLHLISFMKDNHTLPSAALYYEKLRLYFVDRLGIIKEVITLASTMPKTLISLCRALRTKRTKVFFLTTGRNGIDTRLACRIATDCSHI